MLTDPLHLVKLFNLASKCRSAGPAWVAKGLIVILQHGQGMARELHHATRVITARMPNTSSRMAHQTARKCGDGLWTVWDENSAVALWQFARQRKIDGPNKLNSSNLDRDAFTPLYREGKMPLLLIAASYLCAR